MINRKIVLDVLEKAWNDFLKYYKEREGIR